MFDTCYIAYFISMVYGLHVRPLKLHQIGQSADGTNQDMERALVIVRALSWWTGENAGNHQDSILYTIS